MNQKKKEKEKEKKKEREGKRVAEVVHWRRRPCVKILAAKWPACWFSRPPYKKKKKKKEGKGSGQTKDLRRLSRVEGHHSARSLAPGNVGSFDRVWTEGDRRSKFCLDLRSSRTVIVGRVMEGDGRKIKGGGKKRERKNNSGQLQRYYSRSLINFGTPFEQKKKREHHAAQVSGTSEPWIQLRSKYAWNYGTRSMFLKFEHRMNRDDTCWTWLCMFAETLPKHVYNHLMNYDSWLAFHD